ncbi:MAG TPA: universal stress protein [Nitrospirota bacterium]|nr:universal stress protein [Nitrospirota bacterium]
MKKILIAVDDTKGSKNVLSVFHNFVQKPVEVVLLHVEKLQGRSLMIDMLGDAEMSTLKEMLSGTDYKVALDKRAEKILAFYSKELAQDGLGTLKTVRREGVPSEEILKVAGEEGADMIILGQSGKRGFDRFITGKVARYVENNAKVPVLVAKRPLMCEEPYTKRDAWAAVSVTSAIMLALFLLGIILQRGSLIH